MTDEAEGDVTQTSFGYIDLDGFAEINNKHGHSFGDEVLDSISDFGQDFVEDGWEFRREYGQGDEFLVVMNGVGKEAAEEHMERFRIELEQLEPNGVHVTGSIGVATQPEDAEAEDQVIDAADQAMLNAEDWGGNRVVVAGREIPTKKIEVWFEEFMRVDEGDLVTIQLWIDQGNEIRAAEIYNETKEIPNQSHVAGTYMTTPKLHEDIQGIVSEILEASSSETRFKMRGEKSSLEEFDF